MVLSSPNTNEAKSSEIDNLAAILLANEKNEISIDRPEHKSRK